MDIIIKLQNTKDMFKKYVERKDRYYERKENQTGRKHPKSNIEGNAEN